MKIIKEKPEDICVNEMKDGQIAIITKWSMQSYIGLIVQRYAKHLITLGESSKQGWANIFEQSQNYEGCRVRILPPGTKLEI